MQNSETNEQDVIAPGAIASGALYSNRINPCGTVAPHCSQVAGETTDIVCGAAGGVSPAPVKRHSHCSPYIYAALRILKDHGYHTYRLTDDPDLPGAILATKGRVTLMISVVLLPETGTGRPHPEGTLPRQGRQGPGARKNLAAPGNDLG